MLLVDGLCLFLYKFIPINLMFWWFSITDKQCIAFFVEGADILRDTFRIITAPHEVMDWFVFFAFVYMMLVIIVKIGEV